MRALQQAGQTCWQMPILRLRIRRSSHRMTRPALTAFSSIDTALAATSRTGYKALTRIKEA